MYGVKPYMDQQERGYHLSIIDYLPKKQYLVLFTPPIINTHNFNSPFLRSKLHTSSNSLQHKQILISLSHKDSPLIRITSTCIDLFWLYSKYFTLFSVCCSNLS